MERGIATDRALPPDVFFVTPSSSDHSRAQLGPWSVQDNQGLRHDLEVHLPLM
jgi:hypothetical protein